MAAAPSSTHQIPASLDELLAHLNPVQRAAAEAVRGPVAILAGAGTGKTTTITHRIAAQVLSGAFTARELLAVTFTDKAAGEMRARLRRLGVGGVDARTFHSAARQQLGVMWQQYMGTPVPELLPHKALLLEPIVRSLRAPYCFRPRREFATGIEWAKNRRIAPGDYLEAVEVSGHEPPVPADLMQKVFAQYERRKVGAGRMDFEDMLGLAADLLEQHEEAAERIRTRFAAFTVDEYQDVNPLQQRLLDLWLGGRDELCVVGDDYQTIYGFTGATPWYLLAMGERFPDAHVITLEDNYRSSAQVLELANRLVPKLGGQPKTLRATQADGPEPVAKRLGSMEEEAAYVTAEVQRLHRTGVEWSNMAVLYRINARSQAFEDALAEAGVPYQVRDGSYLRRPGPRTALAGLRRLETTEVATAAERVVHDLGYDPNSADGTDDEITRQADLGRLLLLAREYQQAAQHPSTSGFIAELEQRFHTEDEGRGVQLMTFHRAKGLEFDAVFLPHLHAKELPFATRGATADVDGERRLLYVGITRARRELHLTWSDTPSPFLADDLGIAAAAKQAAAKRSGSKGAKADLPDTPVFTHLRAWRTERAKADGVPAYVVFDNKTLAAIAEQHPTSLAELGDISGIGPAKLERFGEDILGALAAAPLAGN